MSDFQSNFDGFEFANLPDVCRECDGKNRCPDHDPHAGCLAEVGP